MLMSIFMKKKSLTNFCAFVLIILLFEYSAVVNISSTSDDYCLISNENGIFSNEYILFSPMKSKNTYLINKDGDIIHNWLSDYQPGLSVYMLENGNILRSIHLEDTGGSGSGAGGGIQEIKWDGTLIWDFRYYGSDYLQHHDIEPLPNGNVLLIAKEYKTYSAAIDAGRNPLLLLSYILSPEYIVEIKPTGPTSGDIVWEWHLWDHLIQDFDTSKDNYGIVEDHPELVDINFVTTRLADWIHANSVDYNPILDQIIISCRNFNEIWVIDHSTTTAEAAGHSGGNSGKGGDLLYRWGNPQTYRAGSDVDQKFFRQHDAQWIPSGYPGEGNILVFNNGQGRPGIDYSSVDEIVPPVDENGSYYIESGLSYGPIDPIWIYSAEVPISFYSPHISGCQRLPNGNTLICSGADGHFFEVTNEKDIVWEYFNYFPNPLEKSVFKIGRYELFFNFPEIPIISGTTAGSSNKSYDYSFKTTDPDGDDIYYYIEWGDQECEDWIGPFRSGQEITLSHIWHEQDTYLIRAKAKDVFGEESGWAYLEVTMPLNQQIPRYPILELFKDRFPIIYHIIVNIL
jgi:hypothetical protein